MALTYVIGAGVAGLSAAVSLARAGRAVTLYEASGQAGGRCRSYFDDRLGCAIDNGNHLLLTGNRSTMGYLADIGAADELVGPAQACFPFLDLRTGERWRLRPNAGRLPWWILDPRRRVPGTRASEYLSGLRIALAGAERTVTDCLGDHGPLFERFWEPLAVAALNSPARTGAARLLWPVLRETFAKGEAACRPRIARTGLSGTFVGPALELLRRRGAAVRFGTRLRAIAGEGGAAHSLDFGTEAVALKDGDSVVLALPPHAAANLIPGLAVPDESHAIVNAHFRLPEGGGLPSDLPFLGLVGGTAQWLFVRGDVASITISAADGMVDEDADAIARKTWRDVAAALGRPLWPLPPYRVVKEKRATFAQTPAQVKLRPGTRSRFPNVYLAGDWIDTGLPATIESAVRAGHMAARAIGGAVP
ncbi:MAG: hydroxysqualene dehydroxylase HpnE [Deltaproteobacteria bacterium]|nr:hydroxysqualene dehydroxylase HpnE [Deltaproteobacteria bacterium]